MRKLMMMGVAMVALSGVAQADDYKRAVLSDSEQRKEFSDVLTAAKAVNTRDCGTTFALNASAGLNATLPPVGSAGCKLKFVVNTVSSTGQYVVLNNDADNDINGILVDAGGTAGFSARDTITFVSANSSLGDTLILESDGTYWQGIAFTSADGGMTFTAAQ